MTKLTMSVGNGQVLFESSGQFVNVPGEWLEKIVYNNDLPDIPILYGPRDGGVPPFIDSVTLHFKNKTVKYIIEGYDGASDVYALRLDQP